MAGHNLLLHICCAPCTIYPLGVLGAQGIDVTGFFHNPNIHPYLEFRRRLETVKEYSARVGLSVMYDERYHMREFLRTVVGHEDERCAFCYAMRLRETARTAREMSYEAFSTTLLYSRYQQHDLIVKTAVKMSEEYGIPFHYHDFREGWREGIEKSKAMGLYRQPYCGCIYSEEERYGRAGFHSLPRSAETRSEVGQPVSTPERLGKA